MSQKCILACHAYSVALCELLKHLGWKHLAGERFDTCVPASRDVLASLEGLVSTKYLLQFISETAAISCNRFSAIQMKDRDHQDFIQFVDSN